jgi:hypothetical protein
LRGYEGKIKTARKWANNKLRSGINFLMLSEKMPISIIKARRTWEGILNLPE